MDFSKYEPTVRLREDRAIWHAERRRLEAMFKKDALAAVGLSGETGDRAYRSAWDDGHSEGYEAVFGCLQTIAWVVNAEKSVIHSDPWADDETYPAEDWRFEVANNDTRLGYLDWVAARRQANDD